MASRNVAPILDLTPKQIYQIFKQQIAPTAKQKLSSKYSSIEIEWEKVYTLAFQCTLDTKIREFQYKILNWILFTNEKINSIALLQFLAPYWNSNHANTRLRLTRVVTWREISVSFDVSGLSLPLLLANGWHSLKALRVALLLLLKEKGSSVLLPDVQMQFMENMAHRHISISFTFWGTPNKGVNGATISNGNKFDSGLL